MIHRASAAAAATTLLALSTACVDTGPERAAYLTLMGDDTLAIEWMEFGDGYLDAHALIRGRQTTWNEYHLELGDDGSLVAYSAEVYAGGSAEGEPVYSQRLVMADGTPTMVTTRNGEESRAELEGAPGAVPFVDMLHWPFEGSLRWQADHGGIGDEVPVFGRRGTMGFAVEENDDGTWALVHPSRGPSTMEIDDEGRILWLDGTGSTRAYDLRRTSWDDLDKVALGETFADRPLGELSGRARIDDMVAGVHFTGDHGVPEKRGRDIFGGLLAYGVWWRTGANAATQISFDGDIVIDGEVIPAGDYSLSSIPEADGGTLIINRRTGQGGQSYDSAEDQARVEMRRDMLEETVERFEIRVVPGEEHDGRIELRWDDTVYWVPFDAR